MFRKIRNKKAQGLMEFCLVVPVILLFTLGVFDVAKANILRLENQQAMQAYLTKAASRRDVETRKVVENAANYMQATSLFCQKVEGATSEPRCKSGAQPVQTKIRMETVKAQSGEMTAGTQVCMAGRSEFKPLYSGVYSGGTMVIYTRACTLLETNMPNTGWQPFAKGAWK